jgi:hypothetical protein
LRDFAFSQAVLAGVRLLLRRPLATLALALVGAAASFAGRVAAVVSAHLAVAALSAPGSLSAITTTTTLVEVLLFLLVMSVIAAAVFRGGKARASGDEVRLFILSLLVFVVVAIALLAVGVGGAVTSIGDLKGTWEDTVMFAALSFGVILALVLASRLSLAGPMTVQDGRLRFRASWRLTRQRQWKILGVFLVTLAAAAAIGGLGSFLLTDAVIALRLDTSLTYDPSLAVALRAVVRPAMLAHVLLQGLLVGLAVILHAASAAWIHRQLVGDPVADQAAVFD